MKIRRVAQRFARIQPGFLQLSSLSISQGVALLLGFATHALLARALSQTDYGLFSSTYSWITMLAPYAVFGVGEWWLLEFGRRGEEARDTLRPAIYLISITTLAAIASALWWLPAGAAGPARAMLVMLIPSQAILLLAMARLQIFDRYHLVAVLLCLPHALRFLVAAIVATQDLSLNTVLVGYALSACVVGVVAAHLILRLFAQRSTSSPSGSPILVRSTVASGYRAVDIARETWPFAAASALFLANMNVGVVLVERIVGPQEAALIGIGIVLLSAIYMLPRVVFQQFLMPRMHRWANRDPNRLQSVFRTSRVAMGVLGLLVGALLALIAHPLLPIMFGPEYVKAVTTVRILAVAVPLRFVAGSYGAVLTSGRLIKLKAACQAFGLIAGLLLATVLVRRLGAPGAAAGLVLSEVAMLSLFGVVVRWFDMPRRQLERPVKEYG